MSLKEGVRMFKAYRHPETALRGKQPYERPQDEALVKAFLASREMRFFSAVIAKKPELPQAEKVGTVLFLALITTADDTVDEGEQFQQQLPAEAFRSKLLEHHIPEVNLSVGELMQITLEHFPEEKQKMIMRYLDDMIDVHADKDKTPAGSYSYAEAVEYRNQTNNPLIDVTLRLVDVDEPAEHERFRTYGLLFQHGDDAEDWPIDAAKGASNLWIGMATDIVKDHPEELQAMQSYLALSEQERPKGPLKKWVENNMPHTRTAYLEEYRKLLAEIQGGAHVGYWMWGRKKIGRKR